MSEDIIIIIVTNTALLILLMMYVQFPFPCVFLKAVSVLWLASIMDRTVVRNININININMLLWDIPVKQMKCKGLLF